MSNRGTNRVQGRGLVLLQDCALSGVASLLAVLLIRWLAEPIPEFTSLVLQYMVITLAGMLCGSILAGSHRVVRRWATLRSSSRLIGAILLKEGILVGCLLAGWIRMPSMALSVLVVLADTMLTGLSLWWIRFAARVFSHSEVQRVKQDAARPNALVAGTGAASVALADSLRAAQGYNIVGYLSADRALTGRVIGDTVVYYCAGPTDLESLQWRLGGVDCVFFPKTETPGGGGEGSRSENRSDAAGIEADHDGLSRLGQIVNRAFDIALSAVLIVVFSPLALVAALAVKAEDGGPVLYGQERIGLSGKPFRILKFRSMRTDAEADGAQLYAGEDDPRLTRTGHFLRAHHLDELPQLWNVLRGDMSFIGYRPERQCYIDRIMERNPRYRYLYQIRPGVTSYATLYNGYTDTLEKMLTRLDLDLYYLRNHSLWFDARVLGLTFLGIVSGKRF